MRGRTYLVAVAALLLAAVRSPGWKARIAPDQAMEGKSGPETKQNES